MTGKRKANILIVDDNQSNLLSLKQVLIKPDRNIIEATSGKHALKILLNKSIDLILLDVNMPGMDGFEVAQILKSSKKTRDIPIIFASAERTEHESTMKGYKEGAVEFLYKPLDPEITKAKVSVLLELQMRRTELLEKNSMLEKYALLINNSADIICIINALNFNFMEVNNALKSILGYSVDEVKNTPLTFYLLEESRAKLSNLSFNKNESFSFETQIYCKDRSIKWLNWNVVNKNGLWFSNARDITDIKESEELKNYLSTVVKQSEDAIYLHNADGKIISWNAGAEKIYGFREEEALQMYLWNIVPTHLLEETQKAIQDILIGKKVQLLETRRITKFGKIIDVVFSASVIVDSSGILKSVAITERNITKQKKADEEIKLLNQSLKRNIDQLEVTNKELESFSYSVSHDLRAPLRAINGFAKMFEDKYIATLDNEGKHLLGVIQKSAKKMGMLIDDLLALSRLGRKEVEKAQVDMTQLTKSVLNEINKSVNHNAEVIINDLHPVLADSSLISQVITNLLSNAIKYSSKVESPVVEIKSELKDDEIIYSIHDNGAGFEMHYAHKLFGVFQRLHSNDEFEGTGVGLAIIQLIIKKHHGRVWAEGEVNKGASFYFSLPYEKEIVIELVPAE